jgi:hypothetical protein
MKRQGGRKPGRSTGITEHGITDEASVTSDGRTGERLTGTPGGICLTDIVLHRGRSEQCGELPKEHRVGGLS